MERWAEILQGIINRKADRRDEFSLILRQHDGKNEILLRVRFFNLEEKKVEENHGLFALLCRELMGLGRSKVKLKPVWRKVCEITPPKAKQFDEWVIFLPYREYLSLFNPTLCRQRVEVQVTAEKIFDL